LPIGEAADRRDGTADAARVEADDIEPGPAETWLRASWAYWTPDPPGPPGLTTSDPIRVPGPVAGSRITGSEKRRHAGRR